MMKNNIEKDIKIKCVEADTTQAALAKKNRKNRTVLLYVYALVPPGKLAESQ